MNSRRRTERGFTVVELLTVIGVITVTLMLVLPAVQAARENAKAIGCKNRLKTLGLALHNYHDTYLTFPPGWILKDDAAKAGPAMNWQVSILPFVDQAPLYNMINFNKPPSIDTVPKFAKALDAYRCPADTTVATDKERGGFGTSNYAGNYGVDKFPGKEKAERKGAHGLFHWNSRMGLRDITDGTSNTLMLGERAEKTGAGIWPAARSNEFAMDVLASCNDAYRINDTQGAFSSQHGGGAYFLICDGSVKFVSEKIESDKETDPPAGLFQKLAHRNDGQVIDLDDPDAFISPIEEKAGESKTPAKAKTDTPKPDQPKVEPKSRYRKKMKNAE